MTRKALLIRQLSITLATLFAVLLLQWTAAYIAIPFAGSIFIPLQRFRCFLLGRIPFSVGDVLYAIMIAWILWKLVRFLRLKQKDRSWLLAFISLARITLAFYLLITILWGILYEQPKLSKSLSLPDLHEISNEELIAFDSVLISRLNHYEPLFRKTDASQCSRELSGTYLSMQRPMRVSVKPSLLGEGLAYWGVSGYYNPFTGEAQVNAHEPDFMLPFVVAHEMAHQTGIAAEDDANLMAYIACVENGSDHARFSAYFNIWLYTHRKVRRIDSNIATHLKLQLNQGTLNRIDVLKKRDEHFHTWLDDCSSMLFDLYLKMGNQEEGIYSYRNVAYSALAWEKAKAKK
ncbi:MAG: DUF3810 domain-containing protein [Chitinophagaceae bacterium]